VSEPETLAAIERDLDEAIRVGAYAGAAALLDQHAAAVKELAAGLTAHARMELAARTDRFLKRAILAVQAARAHASADDQRLLGAAAYRHSSSNGRPGLHVDA
jgi:hypothetical protein